MQDEPEERPRNMDTMENMDAMANMDIMDNAEVIANTESLENTNPDASANAWDYNLHAPPERNPTSDRFDDQAPDAADADALATAAAAAQPMDAPKHGIMHGSMRQRHGSISQKQKHVHIQKHGPIRKSQFSTTRMRRSLSLRIVWLPLLVLALASVLVDLALYVIIRVYVSVAERVFEPREHAQLRRRMGTAPSYTAWTRAAQEMDDLLGLGDSESWQKTDLVDAALLADITAKLDAALCSGDVASLCVVLQQSCCKVNVAGIENEQVYSRAYNTTHPLLKTYHTLVIKSLLRIAASNHLTAHQKYALFRGLSRTYGRTVLCLSGGAAFGVSHFGVVSVLMECGVVPRVISGTSAGSFVGAMLAVRTDAEFQSEILNGEFTTTFGIRGKNLSALFKQFMHTGAVIDPNDWFDKLLILTKGMTFLEAYRKTGRIFNVTVVSSEPHAEPKLLNYLTSPSTLIASAIIASSSIPGLLPPIALFEKREGGAGVGVFGGAGATWRDGSIRQDVPQRGLHQLFNVNFSVVSQVNPHVAGFFFNARGRAGAPSMHRRGHGWRGGYIPAALINYLLLDLQKWLQFIHEMDIAPRIMGTDFSGVWVQRFDGDVTVFPGSMMRVRDYMHLFNDPTPEMFRKLVASGKAASYPKVTMIAYRMRLECVLERVTRDARREIVKLGGTGAAGALPSLSSMSGLNGVGLFPGTPVGGSDNTLAPNVVSTPEKETDVDEDEEERRYREVTDSGRRMSMYSIDYDDSE